MATLRKLSALLFGMAIVAASFGQLNAADPDPLVDNPSQENIFVLRDLLTNGDVTNDTGGVRAAVSTANFPFTKSEGITYVRFQMLPCGVNLPHTHPRATEILTLISGGPLQAGFVDTAGAPHINILCPGDVTLFPRGLLHFEINVGTETADYLSALNSENPGTLAAGSSLFQIPARALATTLNQSLGGVYNINSTVFTHGGGLKMTSSSGCVPGQSITTGF